MRHWRTALQDRVGNMPGPDSHRPKTLPEVSQSLPTCLGVSASGGPPTGLTGRDGRGGLRLPQLGDGPFQGRSKGTFYFGPIKDLCCIG